MTTTTAQSLMWRSLLEGANVFELLMAWIGGLSPHYGFDNGPKIFPAGIVGPVVEDVAGVVGACTCAFEDYILVAYFCDKLLLLLRGGSGLTYEELRGKEVMSHVYNALIQVLYLLDHVGHILEDQFPPGAFG